MIGDADDKQAQLEILREEKQNFLKEEIMDKNFDINWFSEYMGEQKGRFS